MKIRHQVAGTDSRDEKLRAAELVEKCGDPRQEEAVAREAWKVKT